MASQANPDTAKTVYEFSANDIKGEPVSMEKYRGHVLIVVNVASKCGYTAQHYKELNELYAELGETKGLCRWISFRDTYYLHKYILSHRTPHFGIPLRPVRQSRARHERGDPVLYPRPKSRVRFVREGEREWEGGAPDVAVHEEEAGRIPSRSHQVELHQVHCGQGGKSRGAPWTEHESRVVEEEPWEILLRLSSASTDDTRRFIVAARAAEDLLQPGEFSSHITFSGSFTRNI